MTHNSDEIAGSGGRHAGRLPPSSASTWPRQGGFTLIEVLASVGFAATLSFIAVPKAADLFRQYQFACAVNQLAADINRAHMQAVAQNCYVRVRFAGSSAYAFERSTDGVNFTQWGNAILLPSPIIANGGQGPTFSPSGLTREVTTMGLTDGRTTRIVRTNMVGGVSVL